MFVSFLFFFFWGVSITHPVLASFYLGSFSCTSHAGLIFIWGVFLTHPILALFFSGELVLHIPVLALIISGDCWLYCSVGNFSDTSHATFIFVPGVCRTHPVVPSFLCGEFLLHIPTCLHFYAGSFSYISYAGFLLCGEFLLHIPRCGEFVLHIPCWLLVYVASFSYTSRTVFFFFFFLGVLQHPKQNKKHCTRTE